MLRTKDELKKDHVSLIAAGGAFFSLLALFPAVAAVVAIWGLIAEPSEVVRQLDGFTSALPEDIAEIVHDQARKAAQEGSGALLTAILAIGLGVWSASKGMNAVIEGVNIAYDEEDERGFVKKTLLRLILTLGAIVGVVLAIGLVVALPAVLKAVGLSGIVEFLIGAVKWIVLLVGAGAAFAVLYRYAADRDEPRWSWVTPGALLGVVLWLAGSAAFSVYVSNFASYNETYGTIGGAIVLLMWLYLTCFVVLLGAEVTAEVERQTRKDTTEGVRQPMGQRGAHAADTVGEAR